MDLVAAPKCECNYTYNVDSTCIPLFGSTYLKDIETIGLVNRRCKYVFITLH